MLEWGAIAFSASLQLEQSNLLGGNLSIQDSISLDWGLGGKSLVRLAGREYSEADTASGTEKVDVQREGETRKHLASLRGWKQTNSLLNPQLPGHWSLLSWR